MKRIAKRWLARGLTRVSGFIVGRRYQLACAAARRDLPRYLPRVNRFLQQQRGGQGLYHDHSEFKMLELAWWLERLQPRTILELGSGATTSVFAEYASGRPDAKLVSLDQDATFLELTRSRLDAAVRDKPILMCVQRVVEVIDGEEVCFYAPDYRRHFDQGIDLCYVDGPANVSPTDATRLMPCIDAVKLADAGVRIENILFDNRFSSVRYFRASRHGLAYDGELHPSLIKEQGDPWCVVPVRHHSRLWRRRRLASHGDSSDAP